MPSRTPARPLPATLARPARHQQPGRPEYHPAASAPWSTPPPPLAVNARILAQHSGPCRVCQRALLRGDRVADLPLSRATVHVACVTGQA